MKKRGPWQIKKSVVKYKNPWITVREDRVVQAGGKKGMYGVVLKAHGAQVLPLDERGYVYLVKDFQYGMGAREIQVPGGAIDPGERPLAAAKRELREETGIRAKKWTALGRVALFTDIMDSSGYIFLAEDLTFTTRDLDDQESGLKFVKVKFEEAYRMVMRGKITHAQSCVLILKAREYIKVRRSIRH